MLWETSWSSGFVVSKVFFSFHESLAGEHRMLNRWYSVILLMVITWGLLLLIRGLCEWLERKVGGQGDGGGHWGIIRGSSFLGTSLPLWFLAVLTVEVQKCRKIMNSFASRTNLTERFWGSLLSWVTHQISPHTGMQNYPQDICSSFP